MLKKILVGVALVLSCLVGMAGAASDWKKCNTELIMSNPTDSKMVYHVLWIDHDLKDYKGRPIPRCGGEILPGMVDSMSKDFKLCIGRHAALWFKCESVGDCERYGWYQFTIESNMAQVVLTPDGAEINLEVR